MPSLPHALLPLIASFFCRWAAQHGYGAAEDVERALRVSVGEVGCRSKEPADAASNSRRGGEGARWM